MTGQAVFRRVAFFSAVEHNICVNGEWFRDDQRSSPRLDQQINDFLAKQEAEIVFVSNPTVMPIAGQDENTRIFRLAVSIIYTPREVIEYGESHEETTTVLGGAAEIPIPHTPDEIFSILGKTLASDLARREREKPGARVAPPHR